jgi:hypothetical protein
MKNYLETLFEEKGIDVERDVNLEGHIGLTVQMILDYVCQTPKHIQKKIKNTFVQIDFRNGDVMDYVRFLANGIVNI